MNALKTSLYWFYSSTADQISFGCDHFFFLILTVKTNDELNQKQMICNKRNQAKIIFFFCISNCIQICQSTGDFNRLAETQLSELLIIYKHVDHCLCLYHKFSLATQRNKSEVFFFKRTKYNYNTI